MKGELVAFGSPSSEVRVRAKAFGVGSAGCNMIAQSSMPRAAFSTSGADLERSNATQKLLVTPQKLVGLYQTDPTMMSYSPSIAGSESHKLFDDTDVAFLMAGLGGVSGSIGIAVLGELAKSNGVLSVASVACPFSAESERRREFAAKCLRRILDSTDLCVIFGNDALHDLAPRLPLSKAFAVMNGIMDRQASDMAMILDRRNAEAFKEVVGEARYGRFGLGLGRGDERVQRAIKEALDSPWFDFELQEPAAALAVYSAADPWDREETRIVEALQEKLGKARIMYGSYRDANLGDRIRLSLLLLMRP